MKKINTYAHTTLHDWLVFQNGLYLIKMTTGTSVKAKITISNYPVRVLMVFNSV